MAATQNGDSQEKPYKTMAAEKASGIYAYAHQTLDRIVPLPRASRPTTPSPNSPLRSFIVSQVLFSALPLLLFITFILSTLAFSLIAALLFTLFWIGLAFLFLVPALCLTSSVAALAWGWTVGSFLVARWLYSHASATGIFPSTAQWKDDRQAQKKTNGTKNTDIF
ncbi:hypothetical protein PT974_04477 [Cladobotryum mycophilum]|uniref:Uncharacterized protein n=1 Tax=Cladobotryum mycophilum TaxID=491253 RepID=A0ABR0SWD1_9HYPO